jgi:hypothetical protein
LALLPVSEESADLHNVLRRWELTLREGDSTYR